MMAQTTRVNLENKIVDLKKNIKFSWKPTDTEEASEAEYTHNHRNNDEPVEIKEQ